jgi:hypothetical protein
LGVEAFLYADIGAELNGSALTILSMIARLCRDLWAEAARWAALPQAGAIEDPRSRDGLAAQLQEIETIAASVHARPPAPDVLIFVPATLLSRAVQGATGRIAFCGETCHAEVSGPITGDVSAGMLKDAGATRAVLHDAGHSVDRL